MELDFEKEKIQMVKDGKTIDCDILFTFDCEDTMKSYVGYTDNTFGANGRKNMYVSSFNPFGKTLELEDITDPRELDMISEVLEKFDDADAEESI